MSPQETASDLDTVVTWTLMASEDGGTHLRLEHAGFTPQVRRQG